MVDIVKKFMTPRVDTGVIYMSKGDVFALDLSVKMKNLGRPIPPSEIRKILVMVRNEYDSVIEYFESETDGNGSASFIFSPGVAEKFRRGTYNYDVAVVTSLDRLTVASRLRLEVV